MALDEIRRKTELEREIRTFGQRLKGENTMSEWTEQKIRALVREEVTKMLKEQGVEVGKLAAVAGGAGLFTLLLSHRDRIEEMFRRPSPPQPASIEDIKRIIDERLAQRKT